MGIPKRILPKIRIDWIRASIAVPCRLSGISSAGPAMTTSVRANLTVKAACFRPKLKAY
jgi:hypothetical protein